MGRIDSGTFTILSHLETWYAEHKCVWNHFYKYHYLLLIYVWPVGERKYPFVDIRGHRRSNQGHWGRSM